MIQLLIRIRIISLLSCGFLFLASLASAENSNPVDEAAGLYPDPDSEVEQLERIRRNWDLDSVSFAFRSGFYRIAGSLGKRLLEEDLPPEDRALVLGYQLQISLVEGKLEQAHRIRDLMENEGIAPDPLALILLAYFDGDLEEVERRLLGMEEAPLSPEKRAWKKLLDALLLSEKGELETANEGFLLAERLAPSALLRDHFEIIRLRREISTGVYDDEVVISLRESIRSMQGERGGFEAVRLLAMALHRGGNNSEAIELLSSHLTMPGLTESGLRPDFLLLMGMISGPETARGRLALRQLITESEGVELQSIALALLAASTDNSMERDVFLSDLEQWLDRVPPHPLSDRLLACQAFLFQSDNELEKAEKSASILLERYPTSPYATTALRILAYVSWNQSPPRYRTAAGYLSQLRQQQVTAAGLLHTGILIADCYFLNGDYTSASEGYGAVLDDAGPAAVQGIFFQQVLSDLEAENIEGAEAHINSAYADERILRSSIWKAEWNLLDYLRREGRVEKAFERISAIIGTDPSTDDIPPELTLRMRYLSARLNLEAGYPGEAFTEADYLLGDLAKPVLSELSPDLLKEVESHLLLLIGETHYATGNLEDGMAVFQELRQKHPQSGPAILSYLVESRSQSAEDNLVSAQTSLIDLVDRFPESEYAPIALWEAALNEEQRGLSSNFQNAITILENLVTQYPKHGLVFYARLKQGDLARRLNDFPTALLLYERILALYPAHPERFRAEISRADCLMALGSEDSTRFDVAAIIYERNCLLPSAPLPIRLEAGFKWANALMQMGDEEGSEAVFLLIYKNFILDSDMNQHILVEEAGRYWMARVLLEMGSLKTDNGEVALAVTLYQTLISLDLPGSALANSRLDSLR